MAEKLILNADDFGRHPLINQAVEQGVRRGCLRSASLMPGEPYFADAVAVARRCPQLGVGVHFTLVDGTPVLPPTEIPSLVRADGRFYENHVAFVRAYLSGHIRQDEARREMAAQLRKVLAAGIMPTHGDSHQHIHILPGIFSLMLDILAQSGISCLRIPQVQGRWCDFLSDGMGASLGRVGLWGLAAWGRWQAKRRGFVMPDVFAGRVAGSAVDEAFLLQLVTKLSPGITEVMLHPGLENAELAQSSGWQHDYETEFKAICSPHLWDMLLAKSIEPVNFSALTQMRLALDFI